MGALNSMKQAIVLNLLLMAIAGVAIGGVSGAVVEHRSKVSGSWGRFVWMSTFDAENQVRYSNENRPFVRVARDGELLPETKDVIAVIAKYGLVLATGHVSPAEALLM